jgi:Fe-S cluster biogenesis protein NfuA
MDAVLQRRAVEDALTELSAMLAGDGASLQLTSLDEQRGEVELAIGFDGVECEDCVLPPDRLREVVDATLRRAVPGFATVRIADPRQPVGKSEVRQPSATTLRVLDPTGGVAPGDPDPGPDAGALRGKRVGIRVDVLWPAWDYTVEEWLPELERAGATVTTWRRAQGVKGPVGERLQAEYDAFVGGVDVVVSGLGNCGSCTSWSVKDGLNGLKRGLPTVVAVTEHFEQLARVLATDEGRPGLRLVVLPHSLHTLPEDEVRRHARAALPQLLSTLGVVPA